MGLNSMDRESCSPPASDSQIERHQFYAKVSCNIIESNRDINGLGRKVSGMYEKLDDIADKVKEYATRGNTVIACVSILWFLLGGGLTMYVNSVIDTAKQTIAKVNDLDKRMILVESTLANQSSAIESIDKIKRNLATLQKEIEEKNPQ